MRMKRTDSLKTRLIIPVLLSFAFLMITNLLIFVRVDRSVERLNGVFDSSTRIQSLERNVDAMHQHFREYLNTRSDEALLDFQNEKALCMEIISAVPETRSGKPQILLAQHVRDLLESYFRIAEDALQKKQLLVSDLSMEFKQAEEIHNLTILNIQAIDEERFRRNSETYDTLYLAMRELARIVAVISMGISAVVIMIVLQFLKSVTKPLTELSDKAREVSEGNLAVEIPAAEGDDELAVLSRTIAGMLESIRENIRTMQASAKRELEMKEKELRTETLLKDAQLKYYEAQISPHFLFNTLNAGQQLAMMEEADRTYAFIDHTAQFFRGQLRGAGKPSTLRNELDHIEHYLYIMNVRFAGEYTLQKEVDETLLECPFPGMVLQPIVENALHHAFTVEWEQTHEDAEKTIGIRIASEAGEPVITVWDNGAGITDAAVEDILLGNAEASRVPAVKGNGIGMINVRERLRLFFGHEDIMDIRQRESGGTEVEIYTGGRNV